MDLRGEMPEKEANVLPRIDIGLVSESCIDCPATLATFKVVLTGRTIHWQ